jgi:nucleoside-diphosphate kinase
MAGNLTFTMIKPEAMRKGYASSILKMIQEAGFELVALKMKHLSKDQAQEFYSVHAGRPFYDELVDFMSGGPIISAVLKKDNAVEDYRALIGATDPNEAADGTIRKAYATNKTMNAAHGSDSDDNAQIEMDFHFASNEIF